MSRVTRRVAIVTGAARGIGAATVLALAREGWAVVAIDRCADDPRVPYRLATEDDLRAVVAAGAAAHPDAAVEPVIGDAVAGATLETAVALAEERFGGVDAVIPVAGIIAGGVPLWEMPLAEQEAVLEIDLVSVMVAARVGVPALLRRPEPRDGRFLAVASAAAWRGLPMLAAYCAAKAGVVALVRAMAVELRGSGVTANTVSPGSTGTPILDESARLYGLTSAEAFGLQQPLERLLRPDEVAAMLLWLAGPASSAVTGGDFPVDGGLSA
jgi:SDR family mycofactocin-dependent oxidoreductase